MKYTTPGDKPPFPEVRIRITDRGWPRPLRYDTYAAMVDTGASVTCVPEDKVPPMAKTLTTTKKVKFAGGGEADRDFVLLLDARLEVLDKQGQPVATFSLTKMYLLMLKEGLVGRDLLNDCNCTFNGPTLTFDIVKTAGP
jgi:hypothetical protein